MAFDLQLNSWFYCAEYKDYQWTGDFVQKEAYSPKDFAQLSLAERQRVFKKRNSFPEYGLISYTSQYGLACFEGLKSFPQKDGSNKFFRVGKNAQRMYKSMNGLKMPGFPPEMFIRAMSGLRERLMDSGELPSFDPSWEADMFRSAITSYFRPFAFSEEGIGVNPSKEPRFIIASTPVSAYFNIEQQSKAVVSPYIRAWEGGTGWIKSISNYAISILAKGKAQEDGFIEAIFLDGKHRKYLEEGSSSNLFVVFKDGSIGTPKLRDTILPGITRQSVIDICIDEGLRVEERDIDIGELFENGMILFATGTAATIVSFDSITYNGQVKEFEKEHPICNKLTYLLKHIQYGLVEDKYAWMT